MKTRQSTLASLISLVRIAVCAVPLLLAACDRLPEEKPLEYGPARTGPAKPVYHFAIHPLHNPDKLFSAYQPMIDYLNRNLPEVHFELEASSDYQAFEKKFRARAPEFLLPNPWQTLQAIKVDYHVIAMAGDAADFKGIFIVRKGSGIKAPQDLKGKTVSYPSPTALAACIMPQYFLHRHGIDVNKDITNQYVGSQESSIMNVYLGTSAAGVTWPPPWRLFQRDHPAEAEKLQVVWETPYLLNNSVMARNDIAPDLAENVRRLLLNLERAADGPAILAAMSTARFHAADNAQYRQIEEFISIFEREVRPVESK